MPVRGGVPLSQCGRGSREVKSRLEPRLSAGQERGEVGEKVKVRRIEEAVIERAR